MEAVALVVPEWQIEGQKETEGSRDGTMVEAEGWDSGCGGRKGGRWGVHPVRADSLSQTCCNLRFEGFWGFIPLQQIQNAIFKSLLYEMIRILEEWKHLCLDFVDDTI